MIPKLYQKDGTTLIGDLINCIECLVEEERNGIFEVTFQYPNTESISSSLVYDNIVICDANDTLKNQKFRIYDTRRMMNNTIEVYARHISFDLAYDYINSIDITNQSCEYALNTIFRSSQFSTGYVGHSDIVNAQNYKISNCNALEAIAGKQGSIIDTYGTGAEILRDNTDIYVLNRRGNDNEVSIEYAKNMTGFELQENTDDLITRIIPFATYTPEGGEQTRVQGTAVDSSYINNYSHPFIAELDFSDKFEEKEVPTTSKLTIMAQRYFEENKCDLPKQNWKIEFIPLSKCVGYESIEDAISLCDTVTIRDTRYGVDTKAKVIKTVYDVLRERYDSMELGEPRTTLGDIVNTGSEKGEQGPPGPQGPKGEDGNIGDFPDSVPAKPVLTTTLLGFASIQLDWTYENKPYYWYEVYASKTKDFTPNVFDIVHKGQTSSFLFQAKPGETWYFRVCGVNSYDHRSEFSDQIEVNTVLVDNLENYFTTAAIGQAVVGSLTADYMTAGILKGQWIDAKNLSVTDGNGKRTLDIDSFGNVNLDVTTLKIGSNNIESIYQTKSDAQANNDAIYNTYASKTELSQTSNSILSTVSSTYQTKSDAQASNDAIYRTYATKSELSQESDNVRAIFTQAGAYNLIYNGDFKNGLNNWTLSGPNLNYIGIEYGTVSPNNNVSARIYGTIGQEASIKQSIDVATEEAITVSYWMYTASWGVDGSTGVDGTTNPYRNLQMIITYSDNSTAVFGISEWQTNINTWEKFIFTAYPTKKTKSIEIGLYNRDTSRAIFYTDIMVEYGIQATRFTPNPNEIMDGIIRLDKNGITVLQGNNKSVLDSQALKFYENDVPYSKIEGGALEFTDSIGGRVSRMGRYIFSDSGAYVNMLQSYYGQATAIGAIQATTDTEPIINYISASIDTMLSSNYYIKQGGNIFGTWVHNQLWFRPYSQYNYAYPGGVISTYNNEDFNIHGNDNLHLGVLAGWEMKTGLSIVEDPTAANGCHIRANGPFDLNGFAIYGGQIVTSLETQSAAVYALRTMALDEGTTNQYTEDICEAYSTSSLTKGEIHWTNRETYNTTPDFDDETKYTCYVEIPYYMAENIENDYHVNITPISFGQYRVAERNPYYFIVESLEDDFMFTFEVVAKKIEKADTNNVVVANQQYTPTVEDQTGTGLYIDQ